VRWVRVALGSFDLVLGLIFLVLALICLVALPARYAQMEREPEDVVILCFLGGVSVAAAAACARLGLYLVRQRQMKIASHPITLLVASAVGLLFVGGFALEMIRPGDPSLIGFRFLLIPAAILFLSQVLLMVGPSRSGEGRGPD
jgi:hypothetical protein